MTDIRVSPLKSGLPYAPLGAEPRVRRHREDRGYMIVVA
ncbi:MAG: hypothetical protein QOI98_1602 [Solirubrobacteraceae bacterium]|jgi:hypothetical protein|nr:hypothetical protein [Solirubrobacteraceae bacterium]